MGQTLATAQQYTCATDETHDESDGLQPIVPIVPIVPNVPIVSNVPIYTKPPARVYREIVRATIDAMQESLVDLRTENDQLIRQNHILTQQLAGLQPAGLPLPCDKKMNIALPANPANDSNQPTPSPHHGHEPAV